MKDQTREQFGDAFQKLYVETCQFGSDFPYAWMDGFQNMIRYGHTDSDLDNSYSPEEEPNYSNYKAGAKAAMILLSLSTQS